MFKKIIQFLLITYSLICCIIFIIGFIYLFAQSLYGNFSIRQFVFHFSVLSTMDISVKTVIFILVPILLCGFLILYAIKRPLLWLRHYISETAIDKLHRHDCLLSFITSTIAALIVIVTISAYSYPLPQIIKQLKYSLEIINGSKHYDTIIDENFTDPASLQFALTQPKNLIVIFTESLEYTFADENAFDTNLLPNLTQQQGTSFFGDTDLSETNWTFAGMAAAFCGITHKVYIPKRELSDKLVCISDILQKNEYNLYFFKAAPLKFSAAGDFLKKHGFSNIYGADELQSVSAENVYNLHFIGRTLEDSALMKIFQEQIEELARSPSPFMAVALTANTHPFHGHTEKQCLKKYNDMRDSILCSDKILASFVEWFKKQDFAQNTTLLILGDHLMMYNDVQQYLDKSEKREIFNMMWGYAAPKISQKRQFNQFDWAPTLLEMAGFKWNGHKFALGTSLLSSENTLMEIYGDDLNSRLIKNSELFEKELTVPSAD